MSGETSLHTIDQLGDAARTPPHDARAERAILGLCLTNPELLDNLELDGADFYRPAHEWWWQQLTDLHATGTTPITVTTVNAALMRDPANYQRNGGGAPYLFELVQLANTESPGTAPYLAGVIRDHARARRLIDTGRHLIQLGQAAPDVDLEHALADAIHAVEALTRDQLFGGTGEAPAAARADQLRPGGTFVLDTPPVPVPLWGRGTEILLSDGEALLIAGGQGTGKTTIAQQLALGRCGFTEYAELLGYPIVPGKSKVLYLAMDRPRQAARSMRRMVGEAWRDELDQRLAVWQGPPSGDLARFTGLLLQLCQRADADTVILDSLKDAAVGLNDDEIAAGYNRARQTAIAAGVQVIELHHNRKRPNGTAAKRTLDDVYGSTWLTSGAGSVILLDGAPGDPIIELRHLKQPANEVGPLKLIHDHSTGRSTVWHAADLPAMAKASPAGITAKAAAAALFGIDKPQPAEVEKARRRLEMLVGDGSLRRVDGDPATATPARYIDGLALL